MTYYFCPMIKAICKQLLIVTIPIVCTLLFGTLIITWQPSRDILIEMGVVGAVSAFLVSLWQAYSSESEKREIREEILLAKTNQTVMFIRMSLRDLSPQVKSIFFVERLKMAFGENGVEALLTLNLIKKEEVI